jgi:hypothetical protein
MFSYREGKPTPEVAYYGIYRCCHNQPICGLTGKVEYELVNAFEKFTKGTKGTRAHRGVSHQHGATVCDTQNARPLYRSLEPWHVHVEGSRTHTGPNPGYRNAVLLFEIARPTVSDGTFGTSMHRKAV